MPDWDNVPKVVGAVLNWVSGFAIGIALSAVVLLVLLVLTAIASD